MQLERTRWRRQAPYVHVAQRMRLLHAFVDRVLLLGRLAGA
jgi:hypothetical protein